MAEIGMAELLISVFSLIATIIILITTLAYWLERRFTALENEIKRLENRFDSDIKRLETRLESKTARLSSEIRNVETRLGSEIKRLREAMRRLGNAFVSCQKFFIEFLISERVIAREKGDVVKREARRIIDVALTNPIKKEEWKRIKELLDKDELILEEALELRELARKAA